MLNDTQYWLHRIGIKSVLARWDGKFNITSDCSDRELVDKLMTQPLDNIAKKVFYIREVRGSEHCPLCDDVMSLMEFIKMRRVILSLT